MKLTLAERRRVANAVFTLVKEYDKHPWLINNGDCEDFAVALEDRFPEGEAVELELPHGEHMLSMGHFAFKYRGFFFDAEEPYGVEDWRHLPLCARNLRDQSAYVSPHVAMEDEDAAERR